MPVQKYHLIPSNHLRSELPRTDTTLGLNITGALLAQANPPPNPLLLRASLPIKSRRVLAYALKSY